MAWALVGAIYSSRALVAWGLGQWQVISGMGAGAGGGAGAEQGRDAVHVCMQMCMQVYSRGVSAQLGNR